MRAVGIAPGAIAGTVGGPTGRVFGAMGYKAEDHVPVMRWGELGDVAYLALFLVSPAGSWITGEVSLTILRENLICVMQVINVDGGSRHRTDSNAKLRVMLIPHSSGMVFMQHVTLLVTCRPAKRCSRNTGLKTAS